MSRPQSGLSAEGQKVHGRRWVLGIVIGLSLVVLVNGYVVYLASQTPAELERTDYYRASLEHGRVLDALRHGAEHGYTLSYRSDEGLQLLRAGRAVTEPVEASLQMLRPDGARGDFSLTVTFPLDATDKAVLAQRLQPGRWNAELTIASQPVTVSVAAALYVEPQR